MTIKAQLATQAAYDAQIIAAKTRPEVTQVGVATMGKSDVIDLLRLHGASVTGTLAELRERLVSIMFTCDLE